MSGFSFPPNPFLSAWMSAANTAAGSWRGAFTGEWQRQQMAALEAWNRQVLGFWTGAFARTAQAPAPAKTGGAPAGEPNGALTLPSIAAPAAAPELPPMAEAVPLAAAPAAEPSLPASIAPALPEPAASAIAATEAAVRKPKPKGAAGLRTAVARRKGPAPKPAAKRKPTRH